MSNDSAACGFDLERFREYLRLLARLHLDPRVQHKVDPSDLVQETLLKAHRSFGQFRGADEKGLAVWLHRILANTMADSIRRIHRERRDIGLERSLHAALDESSARVQAWLAAEEASPSEQAVRKERLDQLAAALVRLPDEQRRAIELHHLRGDSLAEVAKQMDRSSASVAGLIRRGLIQLREQLDSEG